MRRKCISHFLEEVSSKSLIWGASRLFRGGERSFCRRGTLNSGVITVLLTSLRPAAAGRSKFASGHACH